jgi:ribosomal protein S12 methylthiotransferase accessory factor
VHGLCERIERDANALWLLRSDRDIFDSCVEPRGLGDPSIDALATRIADAGLELRLFDITTSDIGVPVFFATISPRLDGSEVHWQHFDLLSGSGCHPNPIRAAIRAVTEAAQSRVTSITGARDDFDPAIYLRPCSHDLLAYSIACPRKSFAPKEVNVPSPDLLPFLLGRLRRAGIRSVIAVPLANEDGFSVAKVLVPELEHLAGERRTRFGARALRAMAGAL